MIPAVPFEFREPTGRLGHAFRPGGCEIDIVMRVGFQQLGEYGDPANIADAVGSRWDRNAIPVLSLGALKVGPVVHHGDQSRSIGGANLPFMGVVPPKE